MTVFELCDQLLTKSLDVLIEAKEDIDPIESRKLIGMAEGFRLAAVHIRESAPNMSHELWPGGSDAKVAGVEDGHSGRIPDQLQRSGDPGGTSAGGSDTL